MVEQYIRINQGEYGRTLLSGEVFPIEGSEKNNTCISGDGTVWDSRGNALAHTGTVAVLEGEVGKKTLVVAKDDDCGKKKSKTIKLDAASRNTKLETGVVGTHYSKYSIFL